MARLRVRLELNRRSAGVPLDKLASVVEETRKFFHLLAEDVHIEAEHGEWMASDFDTESLNFTAEYSGPVTTDQARAFGAAFAGATSLRRVTIAQFTRIADFLGEDELVGFGLYQADQEAEPSEWRCLSKRDAQRFGQEIQMLAQAAGESHPATSLPAVMNGSVAGRRLFKQRRERQELAADPSKLIREVESNLSRRIDLLEGEVAEQTRKLGTRVITTPDLSEERFKQLLSAMESFWAQAPRQMALLTAPEPVVAAPTPTAPDPVPDSAPDLAPPEPPPAPIAKPSPVAASPTEIPAKKPKRRWIVGALMAAAAVALSFAIPELQREWSRYLIVGTLPAIHPKAPASPPLPAVKLSDLKPTEIMPAKPKPPKLKPAKLKPDKPLQRFDGPQIALEIPVDMRAQVPEEARVQVIVAIDEQGNVTRAEVASTKGQGARLLTKEALDAARQARFRPAREGDHAVESQMVLTYLFKPDSAEF
jgi:TonB family protein